LTDELLVWLSVWSRVQIAYGMADTTAILQPVICFLIEVQIPDWFYLSGTGFSALTLLVGRQEGHLACKNRVVGCWCGYLSGVRCRLAYGLADATATHCLLLQ